MKTLISAIWAFVLLCLIAAVRLGLKERSSRLEAIQNAQGDHR